MLAFEHRRSAQIQREKAWSSVAARVSGRHGRCCLLGLVSDRAARALRAGLAGEVQRRSAPSPRVAARCRGWVFLRSALLTGGAIPSGLFNAWFAQMCRPCCCWTTRCTMPVWCVHPCRDVCLSASTHRRALALAHHSRTGARTQGELLWSGVSPRPAFERTHGKRFLVLGLSSNGAFLVCCTVNGGLLLWNTVTGGAHTNGRPCARCVPLAGVDERARSLPRHSRTAHAAQSGP
jgi:hypothetical protein